MTLDASFREMETILHVEKLKKAIHKTAVEHGWWEEKEDHNLFIKLMLVVTEIAEAAEAFRADNPMSDHIPEFTTIEEELADVLIRILDIASHFDFDIAGALVAKMKYNESRPYRHGGKKL